MPIVLVGARGIRGLGPHTKDLYMAIDFLLPRQLDLLKSGIQGTDFNPIFVLVYETQSITCVIEALTGKSVQSDEVRDGIARFRLSNYLPTGELLIPRVMEAVTTCDWIFLYTGCSYCPEVVYELFQYICEQDFKKPRIVVIAEYADWRSGNEHMQELFLLGKILNLTSYSL